MSRFAERLRCPVLVFHGTAEVPQACLQIAPLPGYSGQVQMSARVLRVLVKHALELIHGFIEAALPKEEFPQPQPSTIELGRCGWAIKQLGRTLQFRDGHLRVVQTQLGPLIIGPAGLPWIESFGQSSVNSKPKAVRDPIMISVSSLRRIPSS